MRNKKAARTRCGGLSQRRTAYVPVLDAFLELFLADFLAAFLGAAFFVAAFLAVFLAAFFAGAAGLVAAFLLPVVPELFLATVRPPKRNLAASSAG